MPNPSVIHDSSFTSSVDTIDIQFESHGTIVLIRGLSEAGQEWLNASVGNNESQYFGNAIAAEPRYCNAILDGALEAGLVVRA